MIFPASNERPSGSPSALHVNGSSPVAVIVAEYSLPTSAEAIDSVVITGAVTGGAETSTLSVAVALFPASSDAVTVTL